MAKKQSAQQQAESRLDNLTLARKEGWQSFVNTVARISPEPLTRKELEDLSEDAYDDYNRQRREWHANLGPIPIDYQRRRRADYAMLLPDKVWAQICRDTATPGPRPVRARIARCFLFERLSGQPASTSPWALDNSAFRTKTADFPRHLTPELAQALNEHAHEFLADQGIDDEPVTWQPPKGVLHGLDLPGPDPATVDIAGLHHVMAAEGKE